MGDTAVDLAALRAEIQRLHEENTRLNVESHRVAAEVGRLTEEVKRAKDETSTAQTRLKLITNTQMKDSLGLVRRLSVDALTDIQKIELDFVLRTALEDVTPPSVTTNSHGFSALDQELFRPLVNSLKRMGLLGADPWYWALSEPGKSFGAMVRHSHSYQDTTRQRIDRLQSLRLVGECYLGPVLGATDHKPPGLVFDMTLTLLELCRYRGISF